jgi:hypothetical protein
MKMKKQLKKSQINYNMGPYEKAARDYEERKRMRKLAGIQEEKEGVDPEFKEKVDKLAKNIKFIADEIRKRNK